MTWLWLWTDSLLYLMLIGALAMTIWTRQREHLRRPWRQVAQSKTAMISLVIFLTFVLVGLLDSIHLRMPVHQASLPEGINASQTTLTAPAVSVLDLLLTPLRTSHEKSYSAPFAVLLKHAPHAPLAITFYALGFAILLWIAVVVATTGWQAYRHNLTVTNSLKRLINGETAWAIAPLLYTLGITMAVVAVSLALANSYHILGTDKVGQDVFFSALKSVRTGLMIGSLTLLFMLPFAVLLGVMAGYFSGWVDDSIQYIYTLLSSVPSVLLIAAAVLSLQVVMAKQADLFPSALERSNARLLALCAILGITGWTPLCRLLRGATLKLKNVEFIEAARAMGVSHFGIIWRHILPNLIPMVLITVAMEFSSLVLIEAILSYIGVGVDPSTFSWGNMINGARLELAKSPVIWWPLSAAFVFMFALTLSANLFADVVREAFDPQVINHEE